MPGARRRRLPARARSLRKRRDHRDDPGWRGASGRAHRQRVHVGFPQPTLGARLRGAQCPELRDAAERRSVRHQYSRGGPGSPVQPVRDQVLHGRGEVRGRGAQGRGAGAAPPHRRPRPSRMLHRPRLPGWRSHDLRRPGGGGVIPRRRGSRALALLLRPLQSVEGSRRNALMSIPLSRPPIDDEIKGAVLKAIDSRQYILGPECRAFEDEFAAYSGTKHAVLTSSATAAIWMLTKALGAGTGDEVLVPAHTAFPTVEAICFTGATPVFVDVDDTYTVDVHDAAAKVTPRTVGFVPVHLYGQAADVPGIQALCEKHGLWLLEDCAQAHGAEWQGKKVGGFGRAGAFSFYPSKNLNVMGDGGLIVTSDDAVAARCRRIRDHGRLNKDVHAEIGFN